MTPPADATPADTRRLLAPVRDPLRAFLLASALAAAMVAAPQTSRAAVDQPTVDVAPPEQVQPTSDTGPADPGPPAHRCDVPLEVAPVQEPVPSLVRAVKEGPRPLKIVVLGSLTGAESPLVRDIPDFRSRLQTQLEEEIAARALDLPLKVEMVGKRRALVGELAALIRREVLPMNPSLVLWNVGRADASQAIAPHRVSQSLKEGLDILQQAGIAAILADIQFHPQFEALYRTDDYRNYVRWVAGKRDVPLLRRYEMIEHWASAGAIDLDSGEDADQQAAYRFIQECLAYQAIRMILGGSRLLQR